MTRVRKKSLQTQHCKPQPTSTHNTSSPFNRAPVSPKYVPNSPSKRGKKKDVLEFFLANWGGYDSSMVGRKGSENTLPVSIDLKNGFGRGKLGLREKVSEVGLISV